MKHEGTKLIVKNQKAFHEYFVEERFEAGIELFGTEVKSVRAGTVSLKEAWCQVKDGELFVRQMNISLTKKEIFSIKIRSGPNDCFCTSGRSSTWEGKYSGKDMPSFPFLSI